ncbi:MAG: hypothetical protein HYX99_01905, partial [Chloroflexi bacterium]|nr:hypothetical protein [Chloroflexota bacterium]
MGYLRLSDGAFAGADADFLARATGAYVSPITEAGGALHQAYQILARDRGVVLVEGQANLGEAVGIEACRQSLEATGARAVIVTRYAPAFSLQPLCRAAQKLSPHVAGVVVNVIPQAKWEWAVGTLVPELGREGLTPLALLPEVWRLYGVSVGQMAEHLEGDIITC